MPRDNESIRLGRAGASDQVGFGHASDLGPLKRDTEPVAVQVGTEVFHCLCVALTADGVEGDKAAGDFVQIGAHNLSSGDGTSLRGPTAAAVVPNESACP